MPLGDLVKRLAHWHTPLCAQYLAAKEHRAIPLRLEGPEASLHLPGAAQHQHIPGIDHEDDVAIAHMCLNVFPVRIQLELHAFPPLRRPPGAEDGHVCEAVLLGRGKEVDCGGAEVALESDSME